MYDSPLFLDLLVMAVCAVGALGSVWMSAIGSARLSRAGHILVAAGLFIMVARMAYQLLDQGTITISAPGNVALLLIGAGVLMTTRKGAS